MKKESQLRLENLITRLRQEKRERKKKQKKKTKQKICEFRIHSINTIELLNKLTVYFEKH